MVLGRNSCAWGSLTVPQRPGARPPNSVQGWTLDPVRGPADANPQRDRFPLPQERRARPC